MQTKHKYLSHSVFLQLKLKVEVAIDDLIVCIDISNVCMFYNSKKNKLNLTCSFELRASFRLHLTHREYVNELEKKI